MKAIKVLIAICFSLVLAACGGGGDSSETPADFSGKWRSNIGGTIIVNSIVQTGSALTMTRISPPLPGSTATGVVNGNTALVIAFINNIQVTTSTLTLINANTISSRLDSCTPPAGYRCLLPVGSTVIGTR